MKVKELIGFLAQADPEAPLMIGFCDFSSGCDSAHDSDGHLYIGSTYGMEYGNRRKMIFLGDPWHVGRTSGVKPIQSIQMLDGAWYPEMPCAKINDNTGDKGE